jgi:hypothetical protein
MARTKARLKPELKSRPVFLIPAQSPTAARSRRLRFRVSRLLAPSEGVQRRVPLVTEGERAQWDDH